jgi:hypothetical protein
LSSSFISNTEDHALLHLALSSTEVDGMMVVMAMTWLVIIDVINDLVEAVHHTNTDSYISQHPPFAQS